MRKEAEAEISQGVDLGEAGKGSDIAGSITDGLRDIALLVDFKLPKNKSPIQIVREDYCSLYADMEGGTFGPAAPPDGHLYTVEFPDGSKTFVLSKKTNRPFGGEQPNPWDWMLMLGGRDMRPWETFVYEWDGKETINVTDPTGKVTKVAGRQGTPSAMLPTLRETLKGEYPGELHGTKIFRGKGDGELTMEAKWVLKYYIGEHLIGGRERDRKSEDLGLKNGLRLTEEGQELLTLLGERGLTRTGALIFITDGESPVSLPVSRGYQRLEVFTYLVEDEKRQYLIGFLGAAGRILIGSDGNQQLEEIGEIFQFIRYRQDLKAIVTQSGSAHSLVDGNGRRISRDYMDLIVKDGVIYGSNGGSYERVRQLKAKNRRTTPVGIAWQDLVKDYE